MYLFTARHHRDLRPVSAPSSSLVFLHPQSTDTCRLFAVYQAVHKAEFLLPAGGAKV